MSGAAAPVRVCGECRPRTPGSETTIQPAGAHRVTYVDRVGSTAPHTILRSDTPKKVTLPPQHKVDDTLVKRMEKLRAIAEGRLTDPDRKLRRLNGEISIIKGVTRAEATILYRKMLKEHAKKNPHYTYAEAWQKLDALVRNFPLYGPTSSQQGQFISDFRTIVHALHCEKCREHWENYTQYRYRGEFLRAIASGRHGLSFFMRKYRESTESQGLLPSDDDDDVNVTPASPEDSGDETSDVASDDESGDAVVTTVVDAHAEADETDSDHPSDGNDDDSGYVPDAPCTSEESVSPTVSHADAVSSSMTALSDSSTSISLPPLSLPSPPVPNVNSI
jgi:hypothetical protein